MNELTLNTIVRREQEIFDSQIDDEIVMANLKTDKFYGLNSVSSRIWQHLSEPLSVRAICDALMEEFDIDAGRCEAEVMAFIQTLLDADLVMLDADSPVA